MNFKNLAEIKDLHEKTFNAARAEKAATFYLLECLHEIDRKRAYLDLGYASLFLYVHRALGYSEAQSFERIEAMRLSFRVDVVGASLKSGELSMTAVAKLAVHAKREKLAAPAVAGLTKELAHKSVREVEKALAGLATVPVVPRERVVPVSATASRLELVIDEECAALLREARELDAEPGVAMVTILKRALKMYVGEKRQRKYGETKITRRTSVEQSKSGERNKEGERSKPDERSERAEEKPSLGVQMHRPSRYIPRSLRQKAFTRAQYQCEFRSLLTGVRCQQKTALELDHKFPHALNGGAEIENLQVLCAQHNRVKGMGT